MSNCSLMSCKNWVIFFSLIIFLAGCSATKKLNESDHLLNKNIIKIKPSELHEQAASIIKQKPNRRILGIFRFHLGIYNLANSGTETKFKKWVKRTIGEEPTLLDTFLTEKSRVQLGIFMQNKGYFNATVTDSISYRKHKKANVYYEVKPGDAYKFRNLYYKIVDEAVSQIVMQDSVNTLIKRGNNYDAGVIQKERERINIVLKNKGYYFFNQQYITFSIDTNLLSNQADVYLLISKENNLTQNDTATSVVGLPFQPYTINNVYVQTDYDPIVKHDVVATDTMHVGAYHFIYSTQRLRYKPFLLLRHVFIKPSFIFKQSDLEVTYRHLQDLDNFKFINIKYSLPKEALQNDRLLDCQLLLTPAPLQDYKLELEGTYSGGNIGIPINLSYRNKNIFRGSELLEIKLKLGLERQLLFADTTIEKKTGLPFFNAYEIGPEISLTIPRFIIPFHLSNKYVYSNPTTNVLASYDHQKRLEYDRTLTSLSWSYSWKQNAHIRHFVYPAEINFVKVLLQPAFEQSILALNDPALINSYDDQFITNGRYAFIFNNQDLYKIRNHIFFKVNFEFAGNTLWAVDQLQNKPPQNGENYTVFGVPYAQYFRPDFDLRYYSVFNASSQLVYRVAAGIGLAYGNSTVIPFEKSFYLGGSTDMRGWRARQLGPGSYSDDQRFEKNGEIKMNGNIEYRFDIFRKLKGATFIDAGNIWLVNPDPGRPGGSFNSSTFVDEIAIGGGVGLRFDFTFFIVRLDAAQKFKDPAMEPGERWVISNRQLRDTIINFGIGYPF